MAGQLHRHRTKKEILEACRRSGGIPLRVTERLGVEYATFFNWRKRYPEIVEIMDAAHAAVCHKAEDVVQTAIDDGDTQTARWWLSRRDRRFSDKVQAEVVTTNDLQTRDKLSPEEIAALQAAASIMGGSEDDEDEANAPDKP